MGPSVYTSAHRLNKFVDKRSVFFYDIIAQPLLLSTLRESDGSRLCEQQTARFNFSFLTTLRTFKFNVYEVLLSTNFFFFLWDLLKHEKEILRNHSLAVGL